MNNCKALYTKAKTAYQTFAAKTTAFMQNHQVKKHSKTVIVTTYKIIRGFYRMAVAFIKWLSTNIFLIAKAMFCQFSKIIAAIFFDGFKAVHDQFSHKQHSLQDNLGHVMASIIMLWAIGLFSYHISANTISNVVSTLGNPTISTKQQETTNKHIAALNKQARFSKSKTHQQVVLPNDDYMPNGVSYIKVNALKNSPLATNKLKSAQYQNGKLKIVNKLFTHPANSDEVFINKIAQAAQIAALSYGVNPSVLIAQAYVESGQGSSQGPSKLATKYNNYFGIKYSGYGQKVNMPTNEETSTGQPYTINADFQVYTNLADSMAGNASLLRNGIRGDSRRYAGTWVENTNSYADATKDLTQNYATATNYNTILNKFIQTYGLYVLDSHAVHNSDLTKAK
jgi:flagellum-specific peptidoglycan hydrolase FlgJ